MNDRQFCSLLIIIIPMLIKEISDNENISEDEATESLYASQLYSDLEREETKLWHLSAKALYELYKQEKQTGRIDYPEEA